MSDSPPPAGSVTVTPAPAPAPNVIVQQPGTLAGQMTSGLYDAFKASPILLLIVILNGFFIGAAGYYLLQVDEHRSKDRDKLIVLIDHCINDTVPVKYLEQFHANRSPN